MGGDTDGTIEIVMRMTKECGIVTETVLTSFVTENTEKKSICSRFFKTGNPSERTGCLLQR